MMQCFDLHKHCHCPNVQFEEVKWLMVLNFGTLYIVHLHLIASHGKRTCCAGNPPVTSWWR